MRISISTKFSALIAGVLVLAIVSSCVAMILSWHLEALLKATIEQNMSGVRAAEELEIALLDQRGLVSSYLLQGGNPDWLLELDEKKENFRKWIAAARKTANSKAEEDLLDELEVVYQRYDRYRDDALDVFDRGDLEGATEILLGEMLVEYRKAYDLCEQFIAVNTQTASWTTLRARHQVHRISIVVGFLVLMCVLGSAALLWFFLSQVVFPLRRMVDEARDFTSVHASTSADELDNELSAVGAYLRSLMLDVSEASTILRTNRSQLLNSEKLATVGKLAASVAHEIRNPLTAINMWLFSLRRAVRQEDEFVHKLELISEEVKRLEQILQDFLEFSRPADLRLQRVALVSLLESTINLLRHRLEEFSVTVEMCSFESIPEITADPDQLKQVFINLIWNAAEAMDAGGHVCVAGSLQKHAGAASSVIVRVRDTGHGISEQVRQRLFEPFFTTKEDGTGLGLSIAARILASHGGRLWLESSTSAGSCFAVELPIGD